MAKVKTRVSDLEEFYIRKNPDNLTESDLAGKLNIEIDIVRNILHDEQQKLIAAKEAEVEEMKKKERSRVLKMLGKESPKHQKDGKTYVMSQSVSEILDDTNKEARSKARNAKQDYIGKSYPDS